jgi:hypothetical protein
LGSRTKEVYWELSVGEAIGSVGGKQDAVGVELGVGELVREYKDASVGAVGQSCRGNLENTEHQSAPTERSGAERPTLPHLFQRQVHFLQPTWPIWLESRTALAHSDHKQLNKKWKYLFRAPIKGTPIVLQFHHTCSCSITCSARLSDHCQTQRQQMQRLLHVCLIQPYQRQIQAR